MFRLIGLLGKINEYYTEQRYPPLVTSDLSKDEVLQSLAEADKLITEIKRLAALP